MNDKRRNAKPAPMPEGASPWSARRRRPRDHEVKREAVIRAAARAFNEHGYHHTSLDDIAADLGVTKPTVYYYVANKEQLLFECFLAGLRPIREALRDAEHLPGSGRDRLDAVIRGYPAAIASEYGWCMVRAHDQDLGPEMRRQINALKSEIDQGIRRLLRAGMDDGSIGHKKGHLQSDSFFSKLLSPQGRCYTNPLGAQRVILKKMTLFFSKLMSPQGRYYSNPHEGTKCHHKVAFSFHPPV